MNRYIPEVYKVIFRRFIEKSIDGRLEISKAREILGCLYHIPNIRINRVLLEMKDQGFIFFNNSKFINLNKELSEKANIEILNF